MAQELAKYSVLFVCMGNICRSPTAEGVFRRMVVDAGLEQSIFSDSAGTHAYHAGEGPDRRAQAAAERRGFSLQGIRARRVSVTDFQRFDYVIAMDEDNLLALRESSDAMYHGKLRLFMEFAEEHREREVPDPYYGGAAGFERVLDLVEDAARGLLNAISKNL